MAIDPAAHLNVVVDANTKQATREMRQFDRQMSRSAAVAATMGSAIQRSSGTIGKHLQNNRIQSENLGTAILRLKLLLGAISIGPAAAGFQALASSAVALVSALVPLTGALAVIPALASAAGQAFGTIKLAGAGIGAALKAASASTAKSSVDASAALERQRAAAERVRNAKQKLSESQRSAKVAQEALTMARRDAVRQLEDMQQAAERSSITESRSVMSLKEARKELNKTLLDPKAGQRAVDDARLRVREAEQDLEDVRIQGRRERKDAAEAKKKGVGGMPAVVAARRALVDSNRAVADASHDLAEAQRASTAAMDKGSAAANTYDQALAKLSPAARHFVKTLLSYRPVLAQLRQAAGKGLFPGLEAGLKAASKNTGVLKRILSSTGTELGKLGEKAGKFLGRADVGKDIEEQGRRNVVTIDRFGRMALFLADALRHVTMAAGPLVDWLTKTALGWSKNIDEAAKAGRESGRMGKFFEHTRKILSRLFSIIGHVGHGLWGVFKAGRDTGDKMWKTIDRLATKFDKWANSFKGQNAMKKWFEKGHERMKLMGDAVDDIFDRVKDLKKEGKDGGDAWTIALSEAMFKGLSRMTENMAAHMVPLAEAFVRGWLEADVWGRLLVTTWLLARFGGLGAFSKLGTMTGAAFGISFKGGADAQIAGLSLFGGGKGGGLKAALMAGVVRGGVGAVAFAAGAYLGDQLMKGWGDKIIGAKGDTMWKRFLSRWQVFGSNMAKTASLFVGRVAAGFNKLPGFMKNPAEKAWSGVRAAFRFGTRRAGNAMGDFGSGVKRIANRTKDILVGAMSSGWSLVRRIFRVGTSKAGDAMGLFGKGIRRIAHRIQVIFTKVGQTVGSIADFLRSAVNKVAKSIGKLKSAIPDIHLKVPKMPDLNPLQKGGAARRRGGTIEGGKPTGDSVPAMLERGEYVLNRNAVSKVGKRQLDEVNFRSARRFQSGGMVAEANRIERHHYPYLWGGGHNSSFSGPYDCSGAVSAVLHAGGKLGSPLVSGALAGWGRPGPGAVTVFANAGHTIMKIGNRFFGTSGSNPGGGAGWIDPAPSASYLSQFTVRHSGPGGAGAMGAEDATIPKFKISGSGPLGDATRGIANRMRGYANSRISDMMAAAGRGGDMGDFTNASGSGAKLMRQISKERGWNFGDWWELDRRESSHGTNLANPRSTARLRGQFLDMNYGKYGPGSDPAQHPSMREQIISMAQYIQSRYGNPSKALRFHDAHNFYRKGGAVGPAGRVGMAAGGLTAEAGKALKLYGKKGKRKKAAAKVSGLVKKIKGFGLSKAMETRLTALTNQAEVYADYADRAGQLTTSTSDAAGNEKTIQGIVKGKNEAGWLGAELGTLRDLRNRLIQAHDRVASLRAQLVKFVQHLKKTVAPRLKKRQARIVKALKGAKGPRKRSLDTRLRVVKRQRRGVARFIKAGNEQNDTLHTRDGELVDALDSVQGKGSSLKQMAALPPVGELGGDIFGVQMRLKELNAPTSGGTGGTAPDSDRVDNLLEMLRNANQRGALSEAAFKVFQDFPPYGGSFAEGGIVPGPTGAPRTIIAHGGEAVGQPGDVRVQVFVHPGGTGADVTVNGETVKAEVRRALRNEIRGFGRTPGSAGRLQ